MFLRITAVITAVLLSCANLWAVSSGECGRFLTWTLDEKAVERVTTQLVYAKEELASAKSYNTTLMEMYNDLKARWNAIWQEPEMTDEWRRVEARKEEDAKEKARQEAEAKRESMARQNRYIGVLDKFIHEGHEALSSFAKTDRVNFNEKESASIYLASWHLL